jgi:N-acyl-phosphatidylethanolamine-hydrolysing phospholipase D
VGVAVGLAVAMGALALHAGEKRRKGPEGPGHRVAGGFKNPEPTSHGTLAVALPFFVRRVWATIVPRPHAAPRVDYAPASVRGAIGDPTVTWVGHSTLLVRMDGTTFLTDPIWSDRASPVSFLGPKRLVPPGVPFDALPPVDFVVVSHSHYDHLDLPTLRRLSNGRTVFLVPLGLRALLEEEGIGPVRELDWWGETRVGDVSVYCVPARHWSQRTPFDGDRTLWAGWVVASRSHRVYFAGDTGFTRFFRDIGERLGPFDLAALPIGAYEPAAMMRDVHLDPEEAVHAAIELGARHVVAVHWGTFDLTDEPLDEPPARFRAAATAAGISARAWVLAVGETRAFGHGRWRLEQVSR